MKLTRDKASEVAGDVIAKLSSNHPEASWSPDDLEPVIDGILTAHGESLESQVERLANFIMREIPGEPSQNEGAIDTAVRIMRNMKAEAKLERFRPLIEAARGVDKRRLISLIGGSELRHALPRGGAADRQMYAIDVEAERQIHSLVEAIPESNNQSGSSQSDHKPAEK